MSRSDSSGPAEQAAADVARLLAGAHGLRRAVELAAEAATPGELVLTGDQGAASDTAA